MATRKKRKMQNDAKQHEKCVGSKRVARKQQYKPVRGQRRAEQDVIVIMTPATLNRVM
jgi:hypothetical protein